MNTTTPERNLNDGEAVSDGVVRPTDPFLGRTLLGRYRIERLVARGGMARVYRGKQEPLGRDCAIKVMDVRSTSELDGAFRQRFFLEAQVTARLNHPHIVTVYDYGESEDGHLFMVMELLRGMSLHRALRTQGPFSVERALGVAGQVSRALREAHRVGLIHRDLKPGNIFLSDTDEGRDLAKVLDFGLVKEVDAKVSELSQSGLFLGSPKYSSPEQILCGPIDVRTDVYAFGILIFETLTGRAPFDAPTMVGTMEAHLGQPVPPVIGPDGPVPEWLEALLNKCLAKRQEERYPDFHAVLAALRLGGGIPRTGAEAFTPMPPGLLENTNPGLIPAYEGTSPSLRPVADGSGPVWNRESANDGDRTPAETFPSAVSQARARLSDSGSIAPTDFPSISPRPKKGAGGSLLWGVAFGLGTGLAVAGWSAVTSLAVHEGLGARPSTDESTRPGFALPPAPTTNEAVVMRGSDPAVLPGGSDPAVVSSGDALNPFAPVDIGANPVLNVLREVQITTLPATATVRWGSASGTVVCKGSPCATSWDGKPALAIVSAEGYFTAEVPVEGDLHVKLQKKPTRATPSASGSDAPKVIARPLDTVPF